MEYKSQHFVPQCYLRSFAIDNERRSIGLYNIKHNRTVNGASIKNQCAKDYFYDKTGALDAVFSGFEGKYAEIVRRLIINDTSNMEDDLNFLRHFSYLQHIRTEAMAKGLALMVTDMADFVFENDAEGRAWATFDPASISQDSISNFIATAPYLYGLQDCIVVNNTQNPFITSDNPAVVVNRFHVQRQGQEQGGAGLLSSGFMLILPLTPRLLFITYDKGVYGTDLTKGAAVVARRTRDVEALNALQVMKASQNLYFDSVDGSEYVQNLVSRYSFRRPVAWHKWTYAVKQIMQESGEFTTFRVVETSAEFRTGKGLMHSKSIAVDPGIWCSLFFLRHKPKVFDTGSGAGLVRSEELMQLRRLLREPESRVNIPRNR